MLCWTERETGGTHMKDLAGKTAFVTGAASGIGFGIASALAQAGVKVMLCDIEEAALAAALEKLRLTNADIEGVRADISLKGELAAAAEATLARYGKVHILVNNAGVGGGGPYGMWSDAAWDWTLGVNLRAVVWGIEIGFYYFVGLAVWEGMSVPTALLFLVVVNFASLVPFTIGGIGTIEAVVPVFLISSGISP